MTGKAKAAAAAPVTEPAWWMPTPKWWTLLVTGLVTILAAFIVDGFQWTSVETGQLATLLLSLAATWAKSNGTA